MMFSTLLVMTLALTSTMVDAQYADCALMNADTPELCEDVCASVYSTPKYTFVNRAGLTRCSCTVGDAVAFQICGLTTTTTTVTGPTTEAPTTNYFESGPTLEQAKTHLVAELGAGCSSAIDRHVDDAVLACIASYSAGDLEPQAGQDLDAYYAAVCVNDCVGELLSTVEALDDAGCVATPPANLTSTERVLYELSIVHQQLPQFCAQPTSSSATNTRYCGAIAPHVYAFDSDPATVTAADCTEVVSYGRCFANVLAGIQVDSDALTNATDIGGRFAEHCDTLNVTLVYTSTSATEQPGTVSSAAGVGAVATTLFAALGAALMFVA